MLHFYTPLLFPLLFFKFSSSFIGRKRAVHVRATGWAAKCSLPGSDHQWVKRQVGSWLRVYSCENDCEALLRFSWRNDTKANAVGGIARGCVARSSNSQIWSTGTEALVRTDQWVERPRNSWFWSTKYNPLMSSYLTGLMREQREKLWPMC